MPLLGYVFKTFCLFSMVDSRPSSQTDEEAAASTTWGTEQGIPFIVRLEKWFHCELPVSGGGKESKVRSIQHPGFLLSVSYALYSAKNNVRALAPLQRSSADIDARQPCASRLNWGHA